MFSFAVIIGVHDDRVIDYLKNEKELHQNNHFKRDTDDEGFVHYSFPNMGEKEFKHIVNQLNGRDGVSLIGVDTQLTEKKIMKLADLITEWNEVKIGEEERPQLYPPGDNGFIDLIDALEKTLQTWKTRYVGGYYTDEKNRADDYSLDISEIIEMYKDKVPPKSKGEMGDYNSKNLNEQKLRKLIRKTIRQ